MKQQPEILLKDLPQHVQEAIKGVRIITAKVLGEPKDKLGNPVCKWCRGPITQKRRRSWCSDRCVRVLKQLENVPNTILDRDKGRCQNCQCDVLALQYMIDGWYHRTLTEQELYYLRYPAWFKGTPSTNPHPLKYRKAWELDHYPVSIVEGGTSTSCGLRTLCTACHKFLSGRQHSERLKQRRKSLEH